MKCLRGHCRRGSQVLLGAMLSAVALSCVGRDPPSITSHDPDSLVPAIKEHVQAGDKSIIPYLVADLESDDAAVRFYAIDGLRRLTGRDMGYLYYGDGSQRRPAVERWKNWLKTNQE